MRPNRNQFSTLGEKTKTTTTSAATAQTQIWYQNGKEIGDSKLK